MAVILIIEDDESVSGLLNENLTAFGYDCYQAFSATEGVKIYDTKHVDLVILDVMLPDMSGFDLHNRFGRTPFIFLTAKRSMADKIRGLTCGADDYITKPFDMLELVARVSIVLSRHNVASKQFRFKDIIIDYQSKEVTKAGRIVKLTPKEYDLLELLTRNADIMLTRQRVLQLIWGYEYDGDDRSLDVHIQKLRKKLDIKEYIVTSYGNGYRFRTNADEMTVSEDEDMA